ncbi:MAG: hypothetical protein JNL63_12745 [Bacteroidia bacterium]|nr:hypothetical protein [Bacteroidia bacterium]
MRRFITGLILATLFWGVQPCFGQKSNKPEYFNSGREPLNERDNNFGGGGKRKLFSRKQGFDHKKKTQHFTNSKKKKRTAFQKKKYTGKKGLFGRKKSSGWGGKAFRKNSKEDKRLFKAPKNKSKDRKKRILKKH